MQQKWRCNFVEENIKGRIVAKGGTVKTWELRSKIAESKRTEMLISKQKKHQMLGMKWGLVKKKRIELQTHFQQVSDNLNFVGAWINMVQKHLMVKRFHDNCRRRILDKIKVIKLVFCINMAKIRFRRLVTHLRPTLNLRNQQQIK